jgi:hypothetical protein
MTIYFRRQALRNYDWGRLRQPIVLEFVFSCLLFSTVVPQSTQSLCSKKGSLAQNSLARGLFYVVNALCYFKIVYLRKIAQLRVSFFY